MLAAVALAAEVRTAVPHYRATRAAAPPVLDGKLDDPAWRDAEASSAFVQKIPNEGVAPSETTTLKIVYDDDAIYVAFECRQTRSPITQRLTRRDRGVEADQVTIDLDTRADGKSAFEFSVNAAGVLQDVIRFNDTDSSADYDENWDARTWVGPDRWTAEMKIPLRILRFHDRPVQSWGLEARRYISARQETDEWAFIPRASAGEVSHYGRLDDLRGLHPGTAFELRPFVLGRVRRRDAVSGQLANGTDVSGSAGLDVKWHPSQDLTLDATLNPDFAQVEADQVVLNLTTYETYYPEKRPFFLEGIDTFATPYQLLYTRRIGRAAGAPTLRTDAPYSEQLVDVPSPATIYGAAKLTGRLSDKWSIGTLQAVTAENDVDVQLGNGKRVQRLVDPTTAFDVVRVKRELGDNAHVGLMATAVTRAEATHAYPELPPVGGTRQQLCPSGDTYGLASRCFDDAYVAASDWRWRSPGGTYVTGGQVVASTLANGPARVVSDGTTNRPGDIGVGAQAYFNKEGGKHVVWNNAVNAMSRRLDFDDLGYNQRANAIGVGGGAEYRELEPVSVFREVHERVDWGVTTNTDGLLLGASVYLETYGKLKNLWSWYADVHIRASKYDDREVGDGTALERARRSGGEIYLATDTTKRVSIAVDDVLEALADGFAEQGNALLTLRVLPQLDMDLSPSWVWSYGEPRYIANGNAAATGATYLFARQDAQSFSTTLRATYTFTPRLTLQAYAQMFLASAHYFEPTFHTSATSGPGTNIRIADLVPYTTPLASNPDFEQAALNVNVVLRWEYLLGSTLFVVYTRSQTPDVTLALGETGRLDFGAVRRAPAADVFLVKLSYWWGK